jgi:menaquinone-dependent protoporphyrinogen oxidase
MKALVAFGTKYGSTSRVAQTIAYELQGRGYRTCVLDLRQKNETKIDQYDLLVLGSSIIIGKWSKESQKFIDDHKVPMRDMRVALFACCSDILYPAKVENARRAYLEDVAATIPGLRLVALGLFGGEIDFSQHGMMVQMLLGAMGNLGGRDIDLTEPYDFRDWNDIKQWARAL